jgi:hypothetical protein
LGSTHISKNALSPWGEDRAMRFTRAALSAVAQLFELSRITRWSAATATVVTTSVAVLLAAFVAVAVGLT